MFDHSYEAIETVVRRAFEDTQGTIEVADYYKKQFIHIACVCIIYDVYPIDNVADAEKYVYRAALNLADLFFLGMYAQEFNERTGRA